MFDHVLSVVVDFSPEVIDHEGLSEVVFIVGERHGLKMECHSCSTLEISELVFTSGCVAIGVEELSHGSSVFREVWVFSSVVPFLIVVDNVISLWGEELVDLFVLEDGVQDPNFIDSGFSTSVSDSCSCYECEESEVDFPDECLVEHQEAETGVTNEGSSPAVIGSVKSLVDLIDIISCSHSPFPEVILEEVVAVVELVRVSLSLSLRNEKWVT